jgi:hypothetical protein
MKRFEAWIAIAALVALSSCASENAMYSVKSVPGYTPSSSSIDWPRGPSTRLVAQ